MRSWGETEKGEGAGGCHEGKGISVEVYEQEGGQQRGGVRW